VSSDWVSGNRHLAIGRGQPTGSSSELLRRVELDARLPRAAALFVIFASSLGLWAGIWALIALLA